MHWLASSYEELSMVSDIIEMDGDLEAQEHILEEAQQRRREGHT